ncbi:oligosaccharide flippase family protein [Oscillatoria amoena NRMC-F 0135]|nr:oligosaccharide flippase family protein [Oscillatoria amoena NRMC-F 0135]
MWQRLKHIMQSNAFASLAGNGVGAVLGIGTLAIQARTLSKADLGSWLVFITTFTLFDVIRSGLILNPVIRNMAGAKTQGEQQTIAGAAWQLCVLFTIVAVAIFTLPGVAFYSWFSSLDLGFFVQWFWLLAAITLPHNLATWFLNASQQFKKVQWVRILNQALFLGFNIGNFSLNLGIDYIFWGFVISQLATSLLTLILGWSRITDFSKGDKPTRQKLFSFGKYSMLTLLVSNLLRSSDTYILGLLLGPVAVSIYNIPQRLLQIFEMPISAISITRLPILAGLHSNGKEEELTKEFHKSAGVLWLGIIPVALVCFIFAEPLVVLLGGEGFRESASVLRFFAVYAAFLPLERYSGIGLDVVNQPRLNLIKVILMLAVNIVGDFAAIYLFPNAPVAAVAGISVITFGSGVLLGYSFLGKHMKFSFSGIISSGWQQITSLAGKLKR